MKFRIKSRKFLCGALFSLLPLAAIAAPGDDAFLQARDAFATGNRAKLARAIDNLQGHELRIWAEYYQLRQQIDENPPGLPDFLALNAGSLPAERLRSDWIKALGKRGQWDVVAREYPLLQQPDLEAQCYGLQARLQREDAAALDDARPIWFGTAELPEPCRPVTDALVAAKKLTIDDIWERVRRLLEAKKPQQALQAARYLPDAQIPDPRALDAATDSGMRFLSRLPAKYMAEAKNNRGQRFAFLQVL